MKASIFAYFLLSLFSCKTSTEKISAAVYNKIISDCPSVKGSNVIIHYFDGDCSACFGKLTMYEDEVIADPSKKAIFIAKTNNPGIFKFNLRSFKIQSCVVIDDKGTYDGLLALNKTLRIDEDSHILSE